MRAGQEKGGPKAVSLRTLSNKKPQISKRSSLGGKQIGELFCDQEHNWHGVPQNPVREVSARDGRRFYKYLRGTELQ